MQAGGYGSPLVRNMSSKADLEHLKMEMMETEAILISQTETETGFHYRAYVGDMASMDYDKVEQFYMPIVEVLLNAEENDTVEFLISSGGGYLKAFMVLFNAISQTNAMTVANIVEDASSAASMLALVCDELVVNPLSSMMIHTISSGWQGPLSDEIPAHDFKKLHTRKLLEYVYADFLTQDELDKIFLGDTKYLAADEIMDRWEKVEEAQQEAQLEAQDAFNQAQLEGMTKYIEEQGYKVTKVKNASKSS